MKFYIYIALLFCCSSALKAQSGLVINEILASNINSNRDEYLDFNDWIELYNNSNVAIDIAGIYISDDFTDPLKHRIPVDSGFITIQPDSFIILWADGNPAAGLLHLNFQLSSDGEQLIFTESDGLTLIDSASFAAQTANISYGRSASNPQLFKYFDVSSPRAANGVGYDGVAEKPVIETPSGNYDQAISAYVSHPDSAVSLYYTLDGSNPALTSISYSGPVNFSASSVFTVRAFKDGFIPSIPVSKVYFINQDFVLPVLSIITDPENLFNESYGIYVNYTKGGAYWERPFSGHLINNEDVNSFDGGIRIQGFTSRVLPKKSFRLFFKNSYGQDRLEYDLFNLPQVKTFKNLVTRSGYDDDISPANSMGTLLRDPLTSEGWEKTGGLTSAGNFATLYINNDYWGIYNIRESINDYFIRDHLGIENFDLLRYDKKGLLIRAGSLDEWNLMWNMIENSDLSVAENYETFKTMVDIDNLLSFQAMVQCTQYRSWGWGAFAYKDRRPGDKWRWTLWDMDRAYTEPDWNGFTDYALTANEKWGNLMIQKLLLNNTFKNDFINRISDFLNAYYKSDRIHSLIDSLSSIIAPEIESEALRWDSSVEKWTANVQFLHDFAEERPATVRSQMENYFALSEPKILNINVDANAGHVKVNSIQVTENNWSGLYYSEVPLKIQALAKTGYYFSGWSDNSLPNSPDIIVTMDNSKTLEPLFSRAPTRDYFEIIAPAVIKNSEKIPAIVRSRKINGEIKSTLNGLFTFTNNGLLDSADFKIKKGSGVALLFIPSDTVFTLSVDHQDYDTEQRQITISNALTEEFHSGILTSGHTVWSPSADHIIESDLTIPADAMLEIEPGTRILLKRHVNITVNGTLNINGSKEYPVFFTSYDSSLSWGGLEFFNSQSSINWAFFLNGGGDPSKGWAHTNTQPVIFARNGSELNLDNVFILDSPGKGAGATNSIFNMNHSIIAHMFHGGEFSYSRIHINNSYIMNIPNDDGIRLSGDDDNDGFHLDHNYPSGGTSIIENSFFIDGKDDGIDQNYKKLVIRNCWIEGWLNEAIATSGGDTIRISNTVTSRSTNGFEAGWGSPQMIINHSVAFNNKVGFRFGDNYNTANTGHMKVTNSISYDNERNLRNYTKHLAGPYPGGIDITFSMTNDTVYDAYSGNITGIPLFDDHFYLLPGSPGASAGINGTNMGLTEEVPITASPVIINEIMYRPPDIMDTKDWIELYNPANQAKNISGWILKDQDNTSSYVIPAGTIINGKDFLVLCEDTVSFKSEHPDMYKIIGNLPFAFNRDGDVVRLYSTDNYLIDSVQYSSVAPWPETANGSGPSLELIDPLEQNSSHLFWMASEKTGGTPGIINSLLTEINTTDLKVINEFRLFQNYPNPFNPKTIISYYLPEHQKVKLSIYDIKGQLVKTIVNKEQAAGEYKTLFNASNMASGIYIYHLKAGNFSQQKKMLFIK